MGWWCFVEGFAVGFGLQAAFVPGFPLLVCFLYPFLQPFLVAPLTVAFSKYHEYLYGGENCNCYCDRRGYSLGDGYGGV